VLEPVLELRSEVSLLSNLVRGKLPLGDIYCYVQLVVGAMYARGDESPYVMTQNVIFKFNN